MQTSIWNCKAIVQDKLVSCDIIETEIKKAFLQLVESYIRNKGPCADKWRGYPVIHAKHTIDPK